MAHPVNVLMFVVIQPSSLLNPLKVILYLFHTTRCIFAGVMTSLAVYSRVNKTLGFGERVAGVSYALHRVLCL